MKHSEDFYQQLLQHFQPKINKRISSIPEKYQEDVKQDLMEKIVKSIDNVDYDDVPGLHEFVKEEKEKLEQEDKGE
ncbi:hypothetical protein [Lentibacillus sediminis]|uniref:hypothetical protein n=1 Tax=Lentibacillus sediminis TaxID=1940529 RepID=UPI000C1B8DBD|nr:hypothetical protein [Lentibacillus sediminis]